MLVLTVVYCTRRDVLLRNPICPALSKHAVQKLDHTPTALLLSITSIIHAISLNSIATMDLNSPVSAPPPGHVSNFEHPQNEAALAYTVLGLALATVTLFTWFRFLVKLYIMQKLFLEDCKRDLMFRMIEQTLTECRADTVRLGTFV